MDLGYHKLSAVFRHDRMFITFGLFALLALVVIGYKTVAERVSRRLRGDGRK